MELDIVKIFIIGLAAFRLTRLFVFDKITEFIRKPFFDEISEVDEEGNEIVLYMVKEKGIKHFFGELLSCHWCTGLWVSIGLVMIDYYIPVVSYFLLMVLSVAGIGSIIETIIGKLNSEE
jgi:hypothetical protein